MKRRYVVAAVAGIAAIAYYFYTPPATVLRVCLGQTFAQVAEASTFPVVAFSNVPSADNTGFGATWVTEPAVIIQFDDPQFGFKLPPTTFAAIGYMDHKVDTITTSPMLKTLSFSETLSVLTYLQYTFQQRGWVLSDNSQWFDLSTKGQKDLHLTLNSQSHWISLRAPGKYSMFFGAYCFKHCDSRLGFDRYLIDISIGRDYQSEIEQEK